MFTKYEKKSPFRIQNAPSTCGCEYVVNLTTKKCSVAPSFHIPDGNIWVCGRHLRRSLLPECSICICAMRNTTERTLDCGHKFHGKCVGIWETTSGKQTCPLCRTSYYKPMTVPPEIVFKYETSLSSFEQSMLEGMLMELSSYGFVTAFTSNEMKSNTGSNWWIDFSYMIGILVSENGRINWADMSEHPILEGRSDTTILELMYMLNGSFAKRHLVKRRNGDIHFNYIG